jgi:hypothetical protein
LQRCKHRGRLSVEIRERGARARDVADFAGELDLLQETAEA